MPCSSSHCSTVERSLALGLQPAIWGMVTRGVGPLPSMTRRAQRPEGAWRSEEPSDEHGESDREQEEKHGCSKSDPGITARPHQSSPENCSQAACLETPSAAPICVQLEPASLQNRATSSIF